jgi:hypothetical protein
MLIGSAPYHPYLDDSLISVTRLWMDVNQLDSLRQEFPYNKNWTIVPKMQVELPKEYGMYAFIQVGARASGKITRICNTEQGNFEIKMNKFVRNQSFKYGDGYGLKLLKFRNPVNCFSKDFSYLQEKITADLMNEAGVLTGRIAFTDLYVNEKYFGLYLVEEDFDPTPFRVDKGDTDDEYMPEIPYKTANYQPKSQSTAAATSTKLTEQQRMKNLEKLPESIRKAMVETPIPQVQGVSIFDDSFINEIANDGEVNLIEEQEIITTKNIKPKTQKITSEGFDYSKIISIIEEVVERKINEYYDSKLVSENVQVRVGNTVFSGNLKPLPKKK